MPNSLEIDIDLQELHDEIEEDKRTLLKNTERFAEAVLESMVEYSTSETSLVVAGSKVNAAGNYIPKEQRTPRHAHPGGWADITGHLANSIQGIIRKHGFQIHMIEKATADYAIYLDNKTGYSVLGGAGRLARKYIRKHQHILFEGIDDDGH